MTCFKKIVLICLFTIAGQFWAKEIEFWLMDNSLETPELMQQYTRQFESETGIKVKIKMIDWGSAWGKFTNMQKLDSVPDVIQIGSTWYQDFRNKKIIWNLSQNVPNLHKDSLYSIILQDMQISKQADFYAAPWFMDIRFLILNRKLYEQFKFTPENFKNWATYRETLLKFKSQNNTHLPVALPGFGDWVIAQTFLPSIWSYGGDVVKKQNGIYSSALLEENTIKGILNYVEFAKLKLVDSLSLTEDATNSMVNFQAGKAFSTMGGVFGILSEWMGVGKKNNYDGVFVVLPIPSGPHGQYSFIGGSYLAVPELSKNKTEAAAFINFLMRDNNLKHYSHQIGGYAPKKGLMKNIYPDDIYNAFEKSLVNTRSFSDIPKIGDVENIIRDGFEKIWILKHSGILKSEGFGDFNISVFHEILINMDSSLNLLLENGIKKDYTLERELLSKNSSIYHSDHNKNNAESTGNYLFYGLITAMLITTFIISQMRKTKK